MVKRNKANSRTDKSDSLMNSSFEIQSAIDIITTANVKYNIPFLLFVVSASGIA